MVGFVGWWASIFFGSKSEIEVGVFILIILEVGKILFVMWNIYR